LRRGTLGGRRRRRRRSGPRRGWWATRVPRMPVFISERVKLGGDGTRHGRREEKEKPGAGERREGGGRAPHQFCRLSTPPGPRLAHRRVGSSRDTCTGARWWSRRDPPSTWPRRGGRGRGARLELTGPATASRAHARRDRGRLAGGAQPQVNRGRGFCGGLFFPNQKRARQWSCVSCDL
jgi:hypothetical protein